MSLSGCRPAVVRSPSSRNRLPALGPRMTSSSALPGGSAPNDAESGNRSSPISSSVRPSQRRGGLAGRSATSRAVTAGRRPDGHPGPVAPAPPAGSRSWSRTGPRRDSAGRTGRSRRVAWLRSASPGVSSSVFAATQPKVPERRRRGPCATRTARACRAGYFRRDASATPPSHLRRASAAMHSAVPGPSARPAPAGGDRRANRNGRDSLTFANSARLAPFASSHEGHSLPGHRANIRGPNRSIRDTWR